MGIFPVPFSKFFQIHGNKTKLHPVCNLSQAVVSGITHPVLLLGIRKDTLYRFFSGLVHPLVDRCVPGIVSHILVCLPDMTGNRLNAIFVLCAKRSGWTVGTNLWVALVFPVSIPVGGTVVQYLVFWTDDAVEMLIIHIFPPFMSVLCLWTLISSG